MILTPNTKVSLIVKEDSQTIEKTGVINKVIPLKSGGIAYLVQTDTVQLYLVKGNELQDSMCC